VIVDELGLRTLVVWIPMLDRDEGSEVPKVSRNIRISPQYFDGEKLVGDELAKTLGVTQTVWDAFLFYPPGARSSTDGGLPVPELLVAQVAGVVVGTPGTLPAVADQSRLAAELRGKAVVIGEQKDIEDILRRVASSFAARHRK
jgi:hypothetical protein